jgi:hypothetical protein
MQHRKRVSTLRLIGPIVAEGPSAKSSPVIIIDGRNEGKQEEQASKYGRNPLEDTDG